jgi:hypothetical protein
MKKNYVLYNVIDDGNGKWKTEKVGRYATLDDARWAALQSESLFGALPHSDAYTIRHEPDSQDESWSGILNQGR